nr:hypothetical protein [Tanacetum cinerariifolium]
ARGPGTLWGRVVEGGRKSWVVVERQENREKWLQEWREKRKDEQGFKTGLRPARNMDVDEKVAIFLYIVAHNAKNRVMICRFHRFEETISRCFARDCNAVIRLHPHLLKKPKPVFDNSTDQRWKWFKEGSAVDGRVLRDALPRPHGLKVPRPCYYLVDARYTNGEGFLAPYRWQ